MATGVLLIFLDFWISTFGFRKLMLEISLKSQNPSIGYLP